MGDGLGLLKAGCKKQVKKECDVIISSPAHSMGLRSRVFSNGSRDDNFDIDTAKLIQNEPLLNLKFYEESP